MKVALREVLDSDGPVSWAHTSEETAQWMAAVTHQHHYDRGLFDAHWTRGRGVAGAAPRELMALEPTRPLYAHAAADNAGSLRMLEKCGFTVTGHGRIFAQARDGEIDELAPTLK